MTLQPFWNSMNKLGPKFCNRKTTLAVLSIIIGVAFALNLWWVTEDNLPPSWDYATYLSRSLEFYDALRTGSLNQFISIFDEPYRPPLVSLTPLPFYLLFGTGYRSAMLANLVFIAILAISTYKLGGALQSAQFGLVAAAIVSTVPGILTYARIFNVDFPTSALVVSTAYAVLVSDGFSKRGMSLLSGTLFGLGMLIKWSFFVFVAPLVVAELVQRRNRISVQNLFLGAAVGILIASSWYASGLGKGLVQQLVYYSWGPEAQPVSPNGLFEPSSLLYYSRITYSHLVGPFYIIALTVLCLSSIITFGVVRRQKRGHSRGPKARSLWSLAFALLFATLVLTFLQNKQPRYFLPATALVVLLLLASGWRLHKTLGPLLLIGIAVSGTFATTVGALQPAIGVQFGLYGPETVTGRFVGYSDYRPPKQDDWKVDSILELIVSIDPEAKVGMLTCHWVFNQDTFHYYALRMGFGGLHFRDYRDTTTLLNGLDPYRMLDSFDFVLKKTGDLGETWNTNAARMVVQRLNNVTDPFYGSWEKVTTFDLPDGSQASIFMRTPPSGQVQTSAVGSIAANCARISRERPSSGMLLESRISSAFSETWLAC